MARNLLSTRNRSMLSRHTVGALVRRQIQRISFGHMNRMKRLIKKGDHMQKTLREPAMRGQGKGVSEGLMKRAGASVTLLSLLIMSLLIAGCGGGGGEGVSSSVVSGVAAVGAPLAGEARIKDSSNREKRTVIGNDGSFAFDVSDMTGPFILQARGDADGESHTLQSFADNAGIAG